MNQRQSGLFKDPGLAVICSQPQIQNVASQPERSFSEKPQEAKGGGVRAKTFPLLRQILNAGHSLRRTES